MTFPSRPAPGPPTGAPSGQLTGLLADQFTDQFADQVADQVASQLSFDDLGRPLREVTFCVVDLETTGGSPGKGARITEIGAVKVRGGDVLGDFQTLVDPGEPIPAAITTLTGITDTMVAGAPTIDAVLPSFLEFARGCVLVAHNAPFDVGFLRHFATELGHPWPRFDVVDTARLARRLVSRDEAPNCKLGTLAALFAARTVPDHRALSDARATVDVLHALIGRVGALGVDTLEELQGYNSRVSSAQRRKRHLADHIPNGPGVYLFRDATDTPLYIGTSSDLRSRVRSYFTAAETRSRMGEMVGLAHRIEAIPCATPLEAEVRESRLIAAHTPPYNRRSRFPGRVHWLKLTDEAWPRLAAVRTVRDDDRLTGTGTGDATYLGPFTSRRELAIVRDVLHDVFPIRECSDRLPAAGARPAASPDAPRSACSLAELGRCLSPVSGAADPERYAATVAAVRRAMVEDPDQVVTVVQDRLGSLARAERFEEAARLRDRLGTYLRALDRYQRIAAVAGCTTIVGAAPRDDRHWEVHAIRSGRLVAAGVLGPGTPSGPFVERLLAGAETVLPGLGITPAATAAETTMLVRWLERPDLRLIRVDGQWASPIRAAARYAGLHDAIRRSREAVVPFDEHDLPRLHHRP